MQWLHASNRRAALRRNIQDLTAARRCDELELGAMLRAAQRREVEMGAQLRDARARAECAERRQRLIDAALAILLTARGRLSPSQARGLLVDLPEIDDGKLDEVVFAAAVFDATVQAVREAEAWQRDRL